MKFALYIALILCSIVYGQKETTSLSLKDYIAIAIENNIELKKSNLNIEIEKESRLKNIFLPSPEVSLNYDFIPTGTSVKNFEERALTISQSFEFPGNYFLRGSRDNYLIEAVSIEYLINKNKLLKDLKTAYYKALASMYLVNAYNEHFTSAGDFYNKSIIRKDAGEGSSLEVLTAQIQLTESKSLYSSSINQYKTSIIDMIKLANIKSVSDSIVLIDSMVFIPVGHDLESLLLEAESKNLEVNRNLLQSKAADVEKTISWYTLFPVITAGYSKQAAGGNSNLYGVSLSFSVPLWFMFNQKSEINTASIRKEIAELNLSQTNLDVQSRIKTAYYNLKNEEENVLLYKNSLLPQAGEVFEIASVNYKEGESSYLELISARQTLLTVKLNYINNILNYYLSLIELESALNISSIKIPE